MAITRQLEAVTLNLHHSLTRAHNVLSIRLEESTTGAFNAVSPHLTVYIMVLLQITVHLALFSTAIKIYRHFMLYFTVKIFDKAIN